MPMTAGLLRFSKSDAPAYRCSQGVLSFRELTAAARRLAALLLREIPPGVPVGIYGHKELLMPVCIAACAIANRPYLPIDRQIPPCLLYTSPRPGCQFPRNDPPAARNRNECRALQFFPWRSRCV